MRKYEGIKRHAIFGIHVLAACDEESGRVAGLQGLLYTQIDNDTVQVSAAVNHISCHLVLHYLCLSYAWSAYLTSTS